MSNRGRCHCGNILNFELGESGYKMRCPRCGSMVRLRVDLPPTVPAKPHVASGVPVTVTEPVAVAVASIIPEPFEMPVVVPPLRHEPDVSLADFDFASGTWRTARLGKRGFYLGMLAGLAAVFATSVVYVIIRSRA